MQKQLSTQAAAAKAIRAELKAAFPTVKFSVRSDSFAGGDAVRISWTDGPMTKEVDAIVGKYQYGHFDGMQDLYENSNRRNDIPQTKYVQTSRSKSEEVRQQIARELNIEEGADLNSGYCENRREYYSTLIHREFSRRSFVDQAEPTPDTTDTPQVSESAKEVTEATSEQTEREKQQQRTENAKASVLGVHWELAKRAHSGTSFVPERRATDYILDYSLVLEQEIEIVESLGGDKDYFKQKFERLFCAWMSAKSNCLSSMITGPSGFPTRRAEKAKRSEDNRYKEFALFREKHIERLRKNKRREERAAVDQVEEMQAMIKKAEKHQELMKAANKILRSQKPDYEKAADLAAAGCPEKHIAELMKPDYMGRIGFPSYRLTNNNANIKRMKQRLEVLKKRAAAETKEIERADGITITENVEADRLQVFFPGKPSDEMRTLLKGRAFKWSPKNGCWQRQLTNNAREALKEILK